MVVVELSIIPVGKQARVDRLLGAMRQVLCVVCELLPRREKHISCLRRHGQLPLVRKAFLKKKKKLQRSRHRERHGMEGGQSVQSLSVLSGM